MAQKHPRSSFALLPAGTMRGSCLVPEDDPWDAVTSSLERSRSLPARVSP